VEGSVEDVIKQPGIDARIREMFLRKYHGEFGDYENSVLWLVNHLSVDMGASSWGGGTPMKSTGGKGVEYYCDRRFRMTIGSKLERSEKTINGIETVKYGAIPKIYAVKNRVARGNIYVDCPIVYGRGASNLLFLKNILPSHGYIKSKGSWKYASIDPEATDEDREKLQGDVNLMKWLNANYDELVEDAKKRGILRIVSNDEEE